MYKNYKVSMFSSENTNKTINVNCLLKYIVRVEGEHVRLPGENGSTSIFIVINVYLSYCVLFTIETGVGMIIEHILMIPRV